MIVYLFVSFFLPRFFPFIMMIQYFFLTCTFFLTFFIVFFQFALEIVGNAADIRFRSAVGSLSRPISSGKQSYPSNPKNFPVTQPIPKLESLIQSTGEAKYISDTESSSMLYAAFTLAEVGSADIFKIDGADAMTLPGVLRVLTAADIPGVNNFNPPDMPVVEQLLAAGKVVYAGQPVAIVVAGELILSS